MRLITSLIAAAALVPALAQADAIKVGIANDISGPFSALGAEARDGFNLARAVGRRASAPRRARACVLAAARRVRSRGQGRNSVAMR